MSDNTTTYKATIDVETKGSDSLAKLNKSLDETIEGFEDIGATIEKTRKALQKAKIDGDKVEFKRLRKELNGLERTFEDTEIQSRRFSDALSEQPGIVGLVGGSLKGLDGGLKVLAANPIIAVVTLLAGLFMLLKESLSKTERGQALLNKASEAFGKVLGPLFAIIEAVAFPIFEYMLWYIEKIGSAFTWLAEKLGIGTKEIEEASRASSEVLQKKYEEQKAAEEEATKALEEEKKKQIEIEKKAAEDRKKLQEEADTILLEAQLSAMDDREREVKERELRYQEELKKLKLAGVTDLTLFEAEYREDLLAINKSYDDAELQREKDQQAKIEAEKQKAQDLEKQRLAEIAGLESQARADKIDRLISEFEFNNTIKAQSFQAELDLFDQTRDLERQELVAQGVSADALIAFDKQTASARIQIERAMQETKLTIISDALGTIAEAVGKETAAGKALAISQALINTYLGATKALATYPPPFGAIAAGTVIAAGLLQVNAIRKQKLPDVPKPGGGTISSSSSGGGTAVSKPTTSFTAPNINTLGGGTNPNNQIAESIAQSRNQPVRAYVVSGDISSQQAMDRRVTQSATL